MESAVPFKQDQLYSGFRNKGNPVSLICAASVPSTVMPGAVGTMSKCRTPLDLLGFSFPVIPQHSREEAGVHVSLRWVMGESE